MQYPADARPHPALASAVHRPYEVDHVLDGSGTITTGGTAQQATPGPVRGYEVINPHATEDLWVADNGSQAAPNAAGSIRIAANGASYWTPEHWPPLQSGISVYAATTGHPYTLRYW